MKGYPPPGPGQGGFGRRFEETIEFIETELRRAVSYVNDAVVPDVRRESIFAMRKMADTLRNLADRFEGASRPAPPNAPPYSSANTSASPNTAPSAGPNAGPFPGSGMNPGAGPNSGPAPNPDPAGDQNQDSRS